MAFGEFGGVVGVAFASALFEMRAVDDFEETHAGWSVESAELVCNATHCVAWVDFYDRLEPVRAERIDVDEGVNAEGAGECSLLEMRGEKGIEDFFVPLVEPGTSVRALHEELNESGGKAFGEAVGDDAAKLASSVVEEAGKGDGFEFAVVEFELNREIEYAIEPGFDKEGALLIQNGPNPVMMLRRESFVSEQESLAVGGCAEGGFESDIGIAELLEIETEGL